MPKLKGSVKESTASREVWYAVGVYDALCASLGVVGVVTSMNDSSHGAESLHYKDRAVDLRSKHISADNREHVFQELVRLLNPLGYDVLFENQGLDAEHYHVEWDPKGSEVFISRV